MHARNQPPGELDTGTNVEPHKYQALQHNRIVTNLTQMETLSVAAGTLCEWCNTMLQYETQMASGQHAVFGTQQHGQSGVMYIERQDWGTVEKSARFCQLCSFFWENIENPVQNEARSRKFGWSAVLYTFIFDTKSLSAIDLRAKWPGSDMFSPGTFLSRLHLLPAEKVAGQSSSQKALFWASLIDRKQAVNLSTLDRCISDQTWELVNSWVHGCCAEHLECNTPKDTWHPTRLLEVENTKQSSQIKLVEGGDIPLAENYMTLSHCWGAVRPLMLTGATKEQLMDSIPVDDLPNTFRDAVMITRRLGVRYLWIDSLCIIQDSAEDWAKEAGLMASVYGNSYCNIAASGAEDSRGGCLRPRERVVQSHAVRLSVHWKDHRYGEEPHRDYICVQSGPAFGATRSCKLAKRAWIFQERMLSRRNIHFGLTQLFWECNTFLACERFPEGAAILSMPGYKDLNKLTAAISCNGSSSTKKDDLLWAWADFVLLYSGSQITYATDRLIAMAGVVNRFLPTLESELLAGIWRTDIHSQLLWKKAGKFGHRASTYLAPSWSWVSLLETLVHTGAYELGRGASFTSLIEFIDVQVQASPKAPKYTVCGGHITARCYMIPASLKQPPKSEHIYNDGSLLLWPQKDSSVEVNSRTSMDIEEALHYATLWAVPVAAQYNTLCGLLLHKIDTGSTSYFERCGFFSISGLESIEKAWGSVLEYGECQEKPERYNDVSKFTGDLSNDYVQSSGVVQCTVTIK